MEITSYLWNWQIACYGWFTAWRGICFNFQHVLLNSNSQTKFPVLVVEWAAPLKNFIFIQSVPCLTDEPSIKALDLELYNFKWGRTKRKIAIRKEWVCRPIWVVYLRTIRRLKSESKEGPALTFQLSSCLAFWIWVPAKLLDCFLSGSRLDGLDPIKGPRWWLKLPES